MFGLFGFDDIFIRLDRCGPRAATTGIITGIGVGAAFSICPLYLSEVTPAASRGKLVSLFDLMINVRACVM